MNTDKHALWVEKYRPKTLDEYIFHDSYQKTAITQMVNDGTIPHLLFSGIQGTGKTTLSFILINALGIDSTDVLIVNASDENSINDMRNKIKGFVSTYAMSGFKIVLLEEADRLSPEAQDALKRIMEEWNENARFIMTCNTVNRISGPIQSRSQHFHFQEHDFNEIAEVVAGILIKEKVKFKIDVLDKYIRVLRPDVRMIINRCQQNSKSGKLMPFEPTDGSSEYKSKILDLLEFDKWEDIRRLACENVPTNEWENLYRFMYENLSKTKKFSEVSKWEAGIVIIADHLYKHEIVADKEINAAAMFIRLGLVK